MCPLPTLRGYIPLHGVFPQESRDRQTDSQIELYNVYVYHQINPRFGSPCWKECEQKRLIPRRGDAESPLPPLKWGFRPNICCFPPCVHCAPCGPMPSLLILIIAPRAAINSHQQRQQSEARSMGILYLPRLYRCQGGRECRHKAWLSISKETLSRTLEDQIHLPSQPSL